MKTKSFTSSHATCNNKPIYLTLGSLTAVALLSGITLSSIKTYADNDAVTDTVTVNVPVACTMTGTGQTSHTATLDPGTYSAASGSDYVNGIGKTTITTFCNDYEGFSIYAIGFSGNTEGDNTLKGTSASGNATIATKAYEQGDTTSNWSMKLTKVTDTSASYNPSNMTITTGYDNAYHAVPDDYTKVVEYKASTGSSATDQTLGAKLETTYAAFVSTTQPADTYTGQVKYVMVHPYNATAPEIPIMSSCSSSPMISTVVPGITYMQDINSNNRTAVLGSLAQDTTYQIKDNRDNETYCVGKLADDNLWMLDNLALDLTNDSILNSLTIDNTNIDTENDPGALAALKGTSVRDPNTDASGKYATARVVDWTSYNSYSAPLVNLTNKDIVPSDDLSTTGGWKVGGYYNFCAASAGSYCYGNDTDYGTSVGNATSSICPKGWRMPTGNTNGEYSALAKIIYGYTSSTSYPAAVTGYRSTLHLPRSDDFYNGSVSDLGNCGYWWSSTRQNDNASYYLSTTNTTGINPAGSSVRFIGFSIRCILDH